MYALVVTLAVVAVVLVYFLPAMVAISRNHLNAMAIFLTNFLLGWTGIGWVFAFIWAFTNNPAVVADKARPAIKLWKFILLLVLPLVVFVLLVIWANTQKPDSQNGMVRAPAVRTGVPVPADELFGK